MRSALGYSRCKVGSAVACRLLLYYILYCRSEIRVPASRTTRRVSSVRVEYGQASLLYSTVWTGGGEA